MEQLKCTECGQVFGKNMDACPNCGCPASECETIAIAEANNDRANSYSPSAPQKPYIFEVDWANKFYECILLYLDTTWKRYFKFSGRASRLEFWNFVIFFGLIYALMKWFMFPLVVFLFFFAIHIIPFMAVCNRRMHDINISNFFFLLVPIVIIIVLYIDELAGTETLAIMKNERTFISLGEIGLILFWCSWALKKSDEGENKYGMPSDIKLQ